MTLTFLLFCNLILLLVGLVVYARWNYGILEKLGITVVKPSFLLGSDPQGYKKVQHLEDYARFKKYGNIFGFYEGRHPQVHVSDPELIKLIMVKDYDHFTERQPADHGHPITNEVLDWQPEDKWRLMRSIITPNFASHRLKDMSECLRELADESTIKFKSEMDGDQVKAEFRRFVTELLTTTIEKCYCGVKLQNLSDSGKTFNDLLKGLIRETDGYDIKHELVRAFPFLIKYHPIIPHKPLEVFNSLIRSLIKSRRSEEPNSNNNNKFDSYKQYNFVDTLIELLAKAEIPENKPLGITETTATSLALEFFLATFDSVSTPIVFLAYYLAKHPTVQEKVLEEVDLVWDKFDEKLGYEAVKEMPYLNACLHETL